MFVINNPVTVFSLNSKCFNDSRLINQQQQACGILAAVKDQSISNVSKHSVVLLLYLHQLWALRLLDS